MKLRADAPIDLQLHTQYSDGQWTADALIDYLLAEGFETAAITDHDRVDSIAALQTIAQDKGFALLPAVELSTHWLGEPVDLLCYGFEPQTSNSPLWKLTHDLLGRQQANIWQTAAVMAERGYPLTDDALQKIVEQPAVQQPHSLVKLVQEQGYGNAEKSAGRMLLDAGLEIVTLDMSLGVEAAHQAGGVCLIAHPGRTDGFQTFDEKLLDQVRAEMPIDGFEVYYPAHSPEQTAMYKSYAEKHDLFISAGSDSHSADKPPIKYRADSSRKLLERLGIHVL